MISAHLLNLFIPITIKTGVGSQIFVTVTGGFQIANIRLNMCVTQPIKVAFGEGLDALIPVLYWPDAVQCGARHGVNRNICAAFCRILTLNMAQILRKYDKLITKLYFHGNV